MIRFVRGAPGSGKSLYALWLITRSGEYRDRPVLWNGFDFGEKDPPVGKVIGDKDVEAWKSFETGSVVVIDEAQRLFGKLRGYKVEAPPRWCEDMPEHRHLGIDFIFITQDPHFLPKSLHKLVGLDTQLVRRNATSSYVWNFPDGIHYVRKASDNQMYRKLFTFDQRLYEMYNSASVHLDSTIPPRPPLLKRIVAFGSLGVVLLVAVLVYFWFWFVPDSGGSKDTRGVEISQPAKDLAVEFPLKFPNWADWEFLGCFGSRCWLRDVEGRVVLDSTLKHWWEGLSFVSVETALWIFYKGSEWRLPITHEVDEPAADFGFVDSAPNEVVSDESL